jgi:hypothetical protein
MEGGLITPPALIGTGPLMGVTSHSKRKMEDMTNLRENISAIHATDHTVEDRL